MIISPLPHFFSHPPPPSTPTQFYFETYQIYLYCSYTFGCVASSQNVVNLPRATFLKKTNSLPPSSHQLPQLLVQGVAFVIPSRFLPFWNCVLPGIAQILCSLSQPLRVHKSSCPAVSGSSCLFVAICGLQTVILGFERIHLLP